MKVKFVPSILQTIFSLILTFCLTSEVVYSQPVSTAEKFNERGYSTTASSLLDGNEVIGEFDGNLSLVYSSKYELQNDLSFDLTINYNANVGHQVFDLNEARKSGYPVNKPVWIIGIKGFALQTTNFEVNFYMKNVSRDLYGEEVPYLIPGYHYTNRKEPVGANIEQGYEQYDLIRILKDDGSVLMLYNRDGLDRTGEYVETNSDGYGYAVVDWLPGQINKLRRMWYKPGDGLTYYFEEEIGKYNGRGWNPENAENPKIMFLKYITTQSGDSLRVDYAHAPYDCNPQQYGRKLFQSIYINRRIKTAPPDHRWFSLTYLDYNFEEWIMGGWELTDLTLYHNYLLTHTQLIFQFNTGSTLFTTEMAGGLEHTKTKYINNIIDELGRSNRIFYYTLPGDPQYELYRKYKYSSFDYYFYIPAYLPYKLKYYNGKETIFTYKEPIIDDYDFGLQGLGECNQVNLSNQTMLNATFRDDFTNYMLEKRELFDNYPSLHKVQDEEYIYNWEKDPYVNYSLCYSFDNIKTQIKRIGYVAGSSSPNITNITKNFSKYLVSYKPYQISDYGAGVIRLVSETIADGNKTIVKTNTWDTSEIYNKMHWLISTSEQISDNGSTSVKTVDYSYEDISGLCNKSIKTKMITTDSQLLKNEVGYKNYMPATYNDINSYYKLGLPEYEMVHNNSLVKSHNIYVYYNTSDIEKVGKLKLKIINSHSKSTSVTYDYYTTSAAQNQHDSVYAGFLKSEVNSNGIKTNYSYTKFQPYIWGVLKYYSIADTISGQLITVDNTREDTIFVDNTFQTKPFKTEVIYNDDSDTLIAYTDYNTKGNLLFEIDINGNYSEYDYDYGGRLLKAKFPGSFYSDGQTQGDTTYLLQNLNLTPTRLLTIGMGYVMDYFRKAVYESDEIIPPDSPEDPGIEEDAKSEGDGPGGGDPQPPDPPDLYDYYLFFEEPISMDNLVNLNYANLNLYTKGHEVSTGQNLSLKILGVTQSYNGSQVYTTLGQKSFTFEDHSSMIIDVATIIQACKNEDEDLYGFKITAKTPEVGDLYRRFYFGVDPMLSISYTAFNAEESNARSSVLFTYDDLNNKVEMLKRFNHDPQNDTKILTNLEYDSFGQLRKTLVQNSSGLFDLKKETNYNYLGLKNDEKDAENRDLYYSYDYFSRIDTLYYDNPASTYPHQTFQYSPQNDYFNNLTGLWEQNLYELKTIKDEEDKTTKIYYHKNGTVALEEKILGGNTLITDYKYDALQRLIEVVPPKGLAYKISFFYDGHSNVSQKTSPDEGTVKFKYDKYDNLRFSLHASAPATDKALMFTKYDQFNRPLATGLLPANVGFDNLDPDKDYSVNQSGFSHFENLNTDTANFVVVNMYDKFERTGIFSNITGGDGLILFNFNNNYNLRGKLVATAFRDKLEDAWSYKLYGYDVLGRCKMVIVYFNSGSNRKTIVNEYDNLGNLTKQVVNNEFHCWYDYDEQGRLKYVWSSIHNAKTTARLDASYTYNKADQVTKLTYLLEEDYFLKQLYSYNTRGWVSSTSSELYQIIHGEETPIEAPPFFGENLTYYKNGNVNTQTITNFGNNNWPVLNFTYSYDGMNRLTQSSCSNSDYSETYMYDANGNFMHKFKNDPTVTIHYYMQNNSNKLEYILKNNIQYSFNYDYRGNLTFDGYRGYSIYDYDHRNLPLLMNRMVIDMRFSYDDAGLRIYKDISGEKEYYLRDHTGKELAVYNLNTGKLKMTNIYGNGLIGRADVFWLPDTCYDEGGPYPCDRREDELYYYIKDHLGSIRATLSRDGEIVTAQDYLPYGEIIPGRSFSSGGLNEKYKFTEKERDDLTGYDYFGARYYDSELARFQTIDPHSDLYPPLSPYSYVGNNPLIYVDPSGMDSIYFMDQENRPEDNYSGDTYTALVIVLQNGQIVGTYDGSTYANSESTTENTPAGNEVNEGWIEFNNESGHHGGTEQGLNLVDENGSRTNTPGTTPDGSQVTMEYVNVHSGASNRGGPRSRGSLGCLTINPEQANNFMNHFDWSGNNGNTGNSRGMVFVTRGGGISIPITAPAPRPIERIRR